MLTPETVKLSNSKGKRGFTLIEILVVLGIIAAVIALALNRVQRKGTNIRTVVRQMATMSKEVRNHARLQNATLRLVFKVSEKNPSYWVEKSTGLEVRDPKAEPVKILDEKDQKKKSDQDEKDKKKPPFEMYTKLTKKEKLLPSGLFFGQVEVSNLVPVKEGMAYIYFSPEGFVEPAVVQITDKKDLTWSLAFNPLTGQADVIPEARNLKDMER